MTAQNYNTPAKVRDAIMALTARVVVLEARVQALQAEQEQSAARIVEIETRQPTSYLAG